MKASELIKAIQKMIDEHGDAYIVGIWGDLIMEIEPENLYLNFRDESQ